MAPRRRGRRQNRPSNQGSTRRVQRAINRLETGVRFTPGPDPTEVTRSPWWPLTLVDTQTLDPKTQTSYKFSTVAKLVKNMLDLSKWTGAGTASEVPWPFLIRIETLRVWGLDKQTINVDAYDGTNNSHKFRQLSDFGSGINFSRVGWRFGVTGNVNTFDGGESPDTTLFSVRGSGKALVYIQVLISVKQPAALTADDDVATARWGFMNLG